MNVDREALLNLLAPDGETILGWNDLQQGAATAAANKLAQNWAANVKDEGRGPITLLELVHDVDDVIAILVEWRDRVRGSALDGTFTE